MPPPLVPAAVGTAPAPPALVVPTAAFALSMTVALPVPPADMCDGSLDVEGFVAMESFFVGTMDDENGDET